MTDEVGIGEIVLLEIADDFDIGSLHAATSVAVFGSAGDKLPLRELVNTEKVRLLIGSAADGKGENIKNADNEAENEKSFFDLPIFVLGDEDNGEKDYFE